MESERGPFDVEPAVVTDRASVLASTGSRYTYAANPLAIAQATRQGLQRLALVGMSSPASINANLKARGVPKFDRRIALTIGLLCS